MFPLFDSLIIFFVSLFSLLILIRFKWFSSNSSMPPSPFRLPIIGNLHQIGSATHRSLKTLARKHGSLMLIHLGSQPVVVASSAEVAREIMKTHDSIFASRPKLRISGILTYDYKNVGSAPYGEYWRKWKSIYVQHLLSPKRVMAFRQVREDETNLMISKIQKNCDSVIDLSMLLMSLTNDLIALIALGRKYGQDKFADQMKELMELFGVYSIGNFVPSLSWMDGLSGVEGRARKLAKELDEFLEGVINEHKQKMAVGDENDVVDVLLKIQREETTSDFVVHTDTIKAFILEMFVGGTDSTFTILEWAISELIRHPSMMKKLQKEVKEVAQGKSKITEEDLENVEHPYLSAVLKETMRLHVPFPLLLLRESTQDVKLMGYDVAAGTQVIINAWMIGRDPHTWEQPDEFKPERFLNSNIDYKGLHHELIPFGAGRRRCPGMHFSAAISKLALANLVYKFNFKLPNEGKVEELDMSDSTGFTIHRKNPLLVVPTPVI